MSTRVRPPAWLWFNLLSVDAPVIALIWQDFLARCYPTALRLPGRAVLGLTVWAIYLADRLLDIRHPGCALESIRHKFYRRHRAFAWMLFSVVIGVDVLVTSLWLRPAVFGNGLVLTGGVIVYLAVFPLTGWSVTAWKKPVAALLFTAGAFLIAWTGVGHPATGLVWPAAAFCALCLGNLLMIERWTREAPPPGHFHLWIWLLFVTVCVGVFLDGAGSSSWFTAILFSAVGLYALARWGRRMSRDARCVLADAVLLTPLLFR